MWCEDPFELFQLMSMLHCDNHPDHADAAYLFGHTRDMQTSILEAGAKLWYEKKTEKLFVCKLAPNYYDGPDARVNNYADFEIWKTTLVDLGVTRNAIHMIMSPAAETPGAQPPLSHTATEAEKFVGLANEQKWRSVFVVAHPMHITRAFTNIVTFVTRLKTPLAVYAQPGTPQPWFEEGQLNQGLTRGSRFDNGLAEEWARLNRWYAKGDLVSLKEVLAYLRGRNSTATARRT